MTENQIQEQSDNDQSAWGEIKRAHRQLWVDVKVAIPYALVIAILITVSRHWN